MSKYRTLCYEKVDGRLRLTAEFDFYEEKQANKKAYRHEEYCEDLGIEGYAQVQIL